MSNVPPPKPAAQVVLIDGDLPWRTVFTLSFKFSVAMLVIGLVLSIPYAVAMGTVGYFKSSAEAERRAEIREQQLQVKEALEAARRDAKEAGERAVQGMKKLSH